MGIGVSLILIAVGAILAFAVNADVSGLEIETVGWILLVVGIVGALLSMMFWSSWGGFSRRETVVREDAGPPRV
jgi:beta-lactamase regulating signal transducer with metallopeptidase domain